jgi:beta-N-acetylhexosaminidase
MGNSMSSSIGPIMFDLIGLELNAEEREILQHPLIGGVIFFTRNYESPAQIKELCHSIRQIRKKPILLTVDQEGGRVQRMRAGFTKLPGMGQIGQLYLNSKEAALQLATSCGWIMAAEVLSAGIDVSFAPVLDLNKKISSVIGDRAFHSHPETVTQLAHAFTQGMRNAGMAAVGKHFPGHGSVSADSHLDLPVHNGNLQQILSEDALPFAELIKLGMKGMMVAHILFPMINDKPVSFSHFWLQEILRKQLQFSGVIFSDALDMHGADVAGNFPERAQAALEAGCDIALICNNRDSVIKTLDGLPHNYKLLSAEKFNSVCGDFSRLPKNLNDSHLWHDHQRVLKNLIIDNEE